MNIFWLLRGGCPFFGKWQVVVDIFWLVVGSGGYILAGGGVGGHILARDGSWWVVTQFSLTRVRKAVYVFNIYSNIFVNIRNIHTKRIAQKFIYIK